MLRVEVVETLGRQDEPASRPVRPVGVLLRTLVQPADFDDLLDQPPKGNTGLLSLRVGRGNTSIVMHSFTQCMDEQVY